MIMSIFMFFLGIHFMIMILAAAYRIVDLWYRIRDFWQPITVRLVVLLVLEGVLESVLTDELLSAFFWGQLSYLAFHIAVFWITRLGIFVLEMKRR